MTEIVDLLLATALGMNPREIIDILIVAVVTYWLLSLIEGTTAIALLRGMAVVFLVGFVITNLFGLTLLNWLFRNAIPALLVAVPILFQQIGRAHV